MESQPIRIQLRKILWENLAGKSCGKFLWGMLQANLVGNIAEKVVMVCNGSRNGLKITNMGNFWHLQEFLSPLQPLKHD